MSPASPVIDCTTDEGRDRGVAEATVVVQRGGIVVLPTDTVYGVGADAFDAQAVAALLAAKGRGREMPPPVLVAGPRTVDGLATEVPAYARALIEAFWPGPLTVILKAQPSLLWDLGDTNGTVAIRMPDHPVTLALLEKTGPMAVTSANRTGNPAATTILEAATQLGSSVEVYLDAGPSAGGQASTIIDCTHDEPVILRVGPISAEQIDAVVSAAGEAAAAADAADSADAEADSADAPDDSSVDEPG